MCYVESLKNILVLFNDVSIASIALSIVSFFVRNESMAILITKEDFNIVELKNTLPLFCINSFNFLLGTEYQRNTRQFFRFDDPQGYTNSPLPLYNSDAPDYGRENTGESVFSFASYFGRVKYSFKDKLDAMALARVDGSSRFGTNNRYGFFPTVSLAYNFSEDNFIKNSKVINHLKIKTGYAYEC